MDCCISAATGFYTVLRLKKKGVVLQTQGMLTSGSAYFIESVE